jgi:integrase
MTKPISEKIVAGLEAPPSGNRLYYYSGSTLQGRRAPSGFAVRVTAAGTKSFVWYHRVRGKPYLETIGRWDENPQGGGLTVLRAIVTAKARADEVHAGTDPRPARTRTMEDGAGAAGETVANLLDEFTARYIEKDAKLRSADDIRSAFDRLVKPAIGNIGIYDLRRKHVVRMLDEIADRNGPVMADRTLAYVRKAFNWHATRDDEFSSPLVRGMARTKSSERARDRVLTDDEIRGLWKALDAIPKPECYARYVRFLLHTGVRRNEASDMRWNEIDGDVWTIPGARTKNKVDHAVPLTVAARPLIGKRPADVAKYPFVFSTTGGERAFGSMGRMKGVLGKKLKIAHWTLHDLRRTARTLMSRAGVDPDHAERAIGHTIPGVRGVYDRHKFEAEKRKAFEALDAQLARILNPTDNVTALTKRRKA